MSEVFRKLYAYANLFEAWERVKKNDGCAGLDDVEIEDFEAALIDNLNDLSEDLKQQRYDPMPLMEVRIAKRNGGTRSLAIPTVRDRVAQTACLQVVNPILEAEFEGQSHAYRKHRSIYTAISKTKLF